MNTSILLRWNVRITVLQLRILIPIILKDFALIVIINAKLAIVCNIILVLHVMQHNLELVYLMDGVWHVHVWMDTSTLEKRSARSALTWCQVVRVVIFTIVVWLVNQVFNQVLTKPNVNALTLQSFLLEQQSALTSMVVSTLSMAQQVPSSALSVTYQKTCI